MTDEAPYENPNTDGYSVIDMTREELVNAVIAEIAEALGKDCRDLSRQLKDVRLGVKALDQWNTELSGRIDNLAERLLVLERK